MHQYCIRNSQRERIEKDGEYLSACRILVTFAVMLRLMLRRFLFGEMGMKCRRTQRGRCKTDVVYEEDFRFHNNADGNDK